ncbi:MAG: cytochrome bd-type quinol oxidase, subunit 1 [Candidatus Parvarchaeum acidophilus ARMAN-5]|uniref:Cytochrome bd-type quinol oxidase, subunit 1 n=1 Tax=Candidatus Parvarchaeum acidophilus ARMAN-5 TaxID=662762 RepID=D6GUB8_PARA5|nr:MAG: cytochrome bd-type quinol oxidase, subunit 1 [Candidatus Parvarchaeum acidophilus ARMAN-5]
MVNLVLFDAGLMGYSLAVHILLVSVGMTLPIIMGISEYISIKYKSKMYDVLAKRLATALIIFFGIGTASGVVVAVELFVLWPKFISLLGQVGLLPLYMEVFAFFTEAVLLGVYIYFWNKFKNRMRHWILSVFISIGAVMSGVFITMINAFMNTPKGFNIPYYLSTGKVINVNPFAVRSTPTTWVEIGHVIGSTIFTGSALFLAYFAYKLLKTKGIERDFYKKAAKICAAILIIAIILTVIIGIQSITNLMVYQPEKFAALEMNFNSGPHIAETIGGFLVNNKTVDAISIPGLMSFLATFKFNGVIAANDSLAAYPPSTWPPVSVVHNTFDIMVGLGTLIGLIMIIFLVIWILNVGNIKRRLSSGKSMRKLLSHKIFSDPFDNPLVLKVLIIIGALSVFLIEDGWVTDEVGRQHWIIYNVMTVAQSANTSPTVIPVGIAIIIFYIAVIPLTIYFVRKVLKNRDLNNELGGKR